MESNTTMMRYIDLKGHFSANYLTNNLATNGELVALVRNNFTKSKVVIYRRDELENEELTADQIIFTQIDWDHSEKECTHINYL